MWEVHARLPAGRGVAVEDEGLAVPQVDGAVDECAEPELRPLQVDKDADRATGLLLDVADHRDPLAHPVMRSMAHVDPEHVGSGGEKRSDGLAVSRSRAERGDDFDAAAAGLQLRSSTIGEAWRSRSPEREPQLAA